MELQLLRKKSIMGNDICEVETIEIKSFEWGENHEFRFVKKGDYSTRILADDEEIFRLRD